MKLAALIRFRPALRRMDKQRRLAEARKLTKELEQN